MSDISRASDVLRTLADAPPTDAAERQRIYAAAKKLMAAVEDPFDTIHRVNFSVGCPITPIPIGLPSLMRPSTTYSP